MKRKLLLLALSLMLISVLFLAACSSNSGETGTEPEAPTTEEPGDTEEGTDGEGEETADSVEGWRLATDKSQIPAASLSRNDTIIIGMNETAGIFSPWFYSTAYDNYVNISIFDYLLEVDYDGMIMPSVADWEISDDGLKYTFSLQNDITFSDGTPLTAHDAVNTYYVLADPTYDGNSDLTPANIKGWDEYKYGDAETIEGITVVDDHTIEVEVTEAGAKTLLLVGNIAILPSHHYMEGFSKGNLESIRELHQKPLGSGQYVFDSYIPGQEIRLTANESYWKGAPNITNLIYKPTTNETNISMLQTGETDFEEGISVNADNVELLESLGFLDLSLLPNNGYGYIAFNHAKEKFQDQRVRQALTYGLNREDIVYAYSQGYADLLNIPQSRVSWAYPDESDLNAYDFDPDRANQLLEEAGWELADDGYRYKDGQRFVIEFAASSPNEVNDAIIPYATENYRDLGIEFVPEQLEFNAVVEKRQRGDFDMLFLAWGLTSDPDPRNTFHTEGSQNDDSYSNAEVDRLIEAGLEELDQDKRREIYNELYQELNEDLPYIFMYQRYNMNTINSRIQGFEISPYRNFAYSLYKAYIDEE
ncbi:ABC transporter substrate-binding protein [Bacillus horti]|uniref:Peptide/nickel transport system substrate-binding protein n=1 Tax=Caldalkalibacillus horti TaxID=77523 RepID=A0ABT9W592_9BACI|nr:ABC transporter substrate-binding protein [Bacillus horti]MDQ0168242.1 peptide/nickel transport system substrate-binding protein [Bacillus horti]